MMKIQNKLCNLIILCSFLLSEPNIVTVTVTTPERTKQPPNLSPKGMTSGQTAGLVTGLLLLLIICAAVARYTYRRY